MYDTLRDGKLVRCFLGYCTVGWVAFEELVTGPVATVVMAWIHGKRGAQQRDGSAEMLINDFGQIETETGRTAIERYWNAP